MSDDPLDALHGRDIDGRYTLQTPLGKGGMGAVYSATQRSMQRIVAVKVIAPRLITDDTVTRRFLREARLSGRIAHPHVVSVFDSGRTPDGLHYLVMERIDGCTLADAIAAEAPFEPARAVDIAAQICDGLAAAHAQDVAHRDLKPANIMLVEGAGAQSVKLLDFGLARSLAGDLSVLTETGVMFGTPAYMPPEVARGENCDGRGDLYALGIVLFEMLSGALPFSGNHALALAMHHANTPPPPLPETVPAPLRAIVRRLLAKTPDARPATAALTRTLLRASLAPESGPAITNAMPAALGLSVPPDRRGARIGWAAIVVGVLAAGGWLLTRPEPTPVEPPEAPPTDAHQVDAPATRAPSLKTPMTSAPRGDAPPTDAPPTDAPLADANRSAAPPSAAPATPALRARVPATRPPRRAKPRAPATRVPTPKAPATAPASKALPGRFIRP